MPSPTKASALVAPQAMLDADARDPLRGFREQFVLPADVIYLDGNSLGALPRETATRVADVVQRQWGQDLITSWNRHDWIGASRRIGDKLAGLIGAKPGEVLVADSTSVNLFKLLVAALEKQPGRSTLLSEPGNFPTDLYMAQGAVRLLEGRQLRIVAADDVVAAIDEDTAVVLLTHIHYKTGRKLDMSSITAAAHAKGALVLWDLSHSVGAIGVDLEGCDADLAVGCGYKYLNGGPGAPGFLFVAERLQQTLNSPLQGWMGHAAGFDFIDEYAPQPNAERFLCGTPPILGMAALEVGLDLMLSAPMTDIAAKAEGLGELLIRELAAGAPELVLVSPRDFAARGSHLSWRHPHAYEICQAMIDRGVIGDFRAPDILRFGLTPLYLGFADIWRAAASLAEVMQTQAWKHPGYAVRHAVT